VDENILKNSESALANSLKEAQNLLFDSSIHYATHFDLFNISHSSINLSKYIEGKAMGSHIDSTPDQQEKAAMTAILYLNDDYEGGELFFREQKIKLKPKAGTVVIFPSYIPFYHQSFTITKGVKYIVAVF
jgi:predicted 2-oxoglutarate/Fe(II)-dependent dioxygenase YbiX